MTAPAAISWAATLGWLDVSGTWLSFLASPWTAWILTGLAILELIGDQLPSTPSRTVPLQFGTRIISGALSGAAILGVSGALAGALGAIIGTLGGRAVQGAARRVVRQRSTRRVHRRCRRNWRRAHHRSGAPLIRTRGRDVRLGGGSMRLRSAHARTPRCVPEGLVSRFCQPGSTNETEGMERSRHLTAPTMRSGGARSAAARSRADLRFRQTSEPRCRRICRSSTCAEHDTQPVRQMVEAWPVPAFRPVRRSPLNVVFSATSS